MQAHDDKRSRHHDDLVLHARPTLSTVAGVAAWFLVGLASTCHAQQGHAPQEMHDIYVVAASAGCPSPAMLAEEISNTGLRRHRLSLSGVPADGVPIIVVDTSESEFSVEVRQTLRKPRIPRSDCRRRAITAAVLVAMTLEGPGAPPLLESPSPAVIAPTGPDQPSGPPPSTAPPPPRSLPEQPTAPGRALPRLMLEVGAAASGGIGGTGGFLFAPGGSLRMGALSDRGFGVSLGVRVRYGSGADLSNGVRVDYLQVPMDLSLRGVLRPGAARLGADVGFLVAIDSARVSDGPEIAVPQPAVGARLAAWVGYPLSPSVSFVATLEGDYVAPISLLSTGELARTPAFWLGVGASLGIDLLR